MRRAWLTTYLTQPPKLKQSVNMARLEIGTHKETIAHLVRELKLNALEDYDDLPMVTMDSSSTVAATSCSMESTQTKVLNAPTAKQLTISGKFVRNWKRTKGRTRMAKITV